MSSDSHATITYTSMSSYEVIVNGYFRMPMDPLDPYVQLVMKAPPSPDYIPGPEAPPSPDYIPAPEYPEYLPPADDMIPAEEQPLPAAVSPTVESPRYITESEPKMEPKEDGGDDEKSEGDSIEYSTSRGDNDADDDGDDLLEDDVDDEDEEESSDSEEENEEHLALTVPTPALHSSIPTSEDSNETEPFEEGESAATLPPFRYRITARIFVQPHILMPFRSKSEVERLLATPTPPLSPISPTSYPLPPFLMPLPILTPLPTSSFLLPLSLPSTSGSESIPEADIPLWKRARFTTPAGRYEIGESFVAAAARQIRPTLTIAESRRAEDRLIGRLRRERGDIFAPCLPLMHRRLLTPKMAPKRARITRANPDPTRTTTATKPMTHEAINNLIAQRVAETLAEYETQRNSVVNGDTSNTTGTGPRTVRPTRECTYKDYLNCGPFKFNGTEGVIVNHEVAYTMPWRTRKQMMTAKYCPRGEIKNLEVELWNLKVKGTDITSYTLHFQELTLLCRRVFPEESDKIERYVGGLPEMIRGNVMSYEPKLIKKAIEIANDQMDQKLLGLPIVKPITK
nr:reverse transcriptase domain-containing protein [Tanacetum cinerariifolium]GFA40318.1 reverse transcriptase domain-containing protein [Tanacetum cinerariifolium]